MSSATIPIGSMPLPLPPRRSTVVIQGKVSIPPWVDDLESYCRWARSDQFPREGWFSYLDSEIWVDLSREEFLTHNQVKAAFNFVIMSILQKKSTGRFVPDRMFLTNRAANLAIEPDGLYYHFLTMQEGRIRLVERDVEGFIELEGSPDIALEVVSKNSVHKDTVRLRELYWKAQIAEYWLVDARMTPPRLEILRHTPEGYAETEHKDGWARSMVFDKEFQLVRDLDPLGHPQF